MPNEMLPLVRAKVMELSAMPPREAVSDEPVPA